ncbi:MAG: alpha/beta hydrolase [Anaerolineae bacterium]
MPQRRIRLPILAFFLLLLALPVFAQSRTFSFDETDCWFPSIQGVTCAVLTVPEDRTQPNGTQVEIPVAIVSPLSSNPDPVPVVYLEGGPGGATLYSIDSFLNHPVRQDHTLILFDQRGTGFAQPSLNCWELEEDTGSGDPVQECRDRLVSGGVNLQMYNSAASAADVADLVAALGYDQVNLWGISYGTKLGLTILRDFPQIVRSAALDSVYAPETDDLQVGTTGFMSAIGELFDRCAADAACGSVYPELESDFYATLDALDAEPVDVTDWEGYLVTLDGAALYDSLFQTLYDSQAIPFLPYAIELLATSQSQEEDDAAYAILSDSEFPIAVGSTADSGIPAVADSAQVQAYVDEYGDIDDSEGMAYSVDCQEEYQLDDPQAALRLAAGAPAPLNAYFEDGIQLSLQDCETWNVQTANPIEGQRVVSNVPTLLFAGAFDPVTPVASAQSALQGLSNGALLVFPNAGHGITATDTPAGVCATDLLVAFFANPTAHLDTSCIDRTAAIDWYAE